MHAGQKFNAWRIRMGYLWRQLATMLNMDAAQLQRYARSGYIGRTNTAAAIQKLTGDEIMAAEWARPKTSAEGSGPQRPVRAPASKKGRAASAAAARSGGSSS